MKHEDIIRLAIEHTIHGLKFDEDGLVRFAKLIAFVERMECAKLADTYAHPSKHNYSKIVADAIRARSLHG